MARERKRLSPEVAARLADLAQQMRELVYGEEGIPIWGTRFSKIESDCLAVGDEMARLMIEQSVEGQARRVPAGSLECPDETAAIVGSVSAVVETPAGDVHWTQPKARLNQARRDFFPAGEGPGD